MKKWLNFLRSLSEEDFTNLYASCPIEQERRYGKMCVEADEEPNPLMTEEEIKLTKEKFTAGIFAYKRRTNCNMTYAKSVAEWTCPKTFVCSKCDEPYDYSKFEYKK